MCFWWPWWRKQAKTRWCHDVVLPILSGSLSICSTKTLNNMNKREREGKKLTYHSNHKIFSEIFILIVLHFFLFIFLVQLHCIFLLFHILQLFWILTRCYTASVHPSDCFIAWFSKLKHIYSKRDVETQKTAQTAQRSVIKSY